MPQSPRLRALWQEYCGDGLVVATQIEGDVANRMTAAGQALPRIDEGQGGFWIVYLACQQGRAAGAAIAAAALIFQLVTVALQCVEQRLTWVSLHGAVPALYDGQRLLAFTFQGLDGPLWHQQGITHSSKSPRSSWLTSLSI